MKKRNNLVKFPKDEEIIKKLSDPTYEGNRGLSLNASPLEKVKYELCQSILAYKQKGKFSPEKLAQKIQLSVAETKELLFSHTDKFTLDRLITYTANLGIGLKITEIKTSYKNPKPISYQHLAKSKL